MDLRKLSGDSLIGVTSGDLAVEALVTNNPHLIDPKFTLGRIVVLPERAPVNLIAPSQSAAEQIEIVDSLASKLLEEVKIECGDGCDASADTFTGDVPEIEMVVVSTGVICANANMCSSSCPAGVREEL